MALKPNSSRNLLVPLLWGAMLLTSGPGISHAAEEAAAADPATVQRLIAELGSEKFSLREGASEKLLKLGTLALPSLEAAATHPDREVRFRAVRLLSTIRESDLNRRLEAFLAGQGDPREYHLPAWDKFQQLYGDEKASRELFVEMQRADADLLAAFEKGPREAADLLTTRAQQHQQFLQQRSGTLSLGQVASLLLVAGDEEVKLQAQTSQYVLGFCHQQSLRQAVSEKKFAAIPRQMLGSLVRRSDDWMAYNAMMIAYQHNLEEGLIPALKILNASGNRVAHMTQYALLLVSKLGDESHLPVVEKMLSDKGTMLHMQQDKTRYEVQFRDAALAAAVYLTKQKIYDYFPTPAEQNVGSEPQQVFFNIRAIGFSNEADRERVHAKWAAYRAKQKQSAAAK